MEMKSTRELWGGVDGICDHGEFEKWHYYKGTYLRNGGREVQTSSVGWYKLKVSTCIVSRIISLPRIVVVILTA